MCKPEEQLSENTTTEEKAAEESDIPPADELHFLEPSEVHFRCEINRLQMKKEGDEEWREVTLARLFPLSDPYKWLAVLNKEDKEIGVLHDLHGLSSDEFACVEEELRRRYLIPEIKSILSRRDRFDMVEWTVETDRGRATFLTRQLHENVQRPIAGRIVIADVENNRYDIPDVDALDPESRRLLEERL